MIESIRVVRIAWNWAAIAVWVCLTGTAAAVAPEPTNAPTSAAYESPAEFGNALVSSLNNHDVDAMAMFFDIPAFARRVAAASSDNARGRERAAAIYEQSGSHELFSYLGFDHNRFVAKYMRWQQHGASIVVVIREDSDGLGMEYLEFELVRDRAGKLRAVDCYALNGGGSVSAAMGTMLRLKPGYEENVGPPTESQAVREQIDRYRSASKNNNLEGVMAALGQLPPQYSQSLPILNLRTQFAVLAKEPEEAKRILAVMAGKYDDEPAGAMRLTPYYRDTRQFDKALHSVDVIEHSVGADCTTSIERALVYHVRGDESRTAKAIQDGIGLEPDCRLAYYMLGSSYVLMKDYPQAIATYKDLATHFGTPVDRKPFESNPAYADFVKSDEYKRWLPN